MRVVVDYNLCESNAICMGIVPEVFEVRDDNFLYVLQENPPDELREKCEQAVQQCPKQAQNSLEWQCVSRSTWGLAILRQRDSVRPPPAGRRTGCGPCRRRCVRGSRGWRSQWQGFSREGNYPGRKQGPRFLYCRSGGHALQGGLQGLHRRPEP